MSDSRRTNGRHYTSREIIHRVIDPLFLDELRAELDAIKRKTDRLAALERFQDKLASLTFLDPACGSGNFLIETCNSLRALENEVLGEMLKLGVSGETGVTLDQFFGIELESSACELAARHCARIVCGNALELDWNEVVPGGVDYIIGNPPFVGASMMNAEQKRQAVAIFGTGRLVKSLDYVGAWFCKAAALMRGTETRAAFVSTSSICQGEQVAPLWQKLFGDFGIHIDFARRTFRWQSDLENSAAVHCVIIGFSHAPSGRRKIIFDGERKLVARNINAYLLDAPDVFIRSRSKPLCNDAPRVTKGNQPTDGGNLLLTCEERERLLRDAPALECCIRRYIGARDFISGDEVRYCLWLQGVEPGVYCDNEEIARRLDAVRKFRAASTSKPTRVMAEKAALFFSRPQSDGQSSLLIPRVSTSARRYIPMAFAGAGDIASDSLSIVHGADRFHFGVLESSVHMAWTRAVCGRFGDEYRYSGSVVCNNFVWCERSARIESTAQSILDARSRYSDRSLAFLYDETTMPDELRAAHTENDRAVLSAYGFSESMSEAEIVARLMEMYQQLTEAIDHE